LLLQLAEALSPATQQVGLLLSSALRTLLPRNKTANANGYMYQLWRHGSQQSLSGQSGKLASFAFLESGFLCYYKLPATSNACSSVACTVLSPTHEFTVPPQITVFLGSLHTLLTEQTRSESETEQSQCWWPRTAKKVSQCSLILFVDGIMPIGKAANAGLWRKALLGLGSERS
jgi:hypothetical protein